MTTYSPEADGLPDPGEVVWTWVPYEEDPAQGKDRPVVVLSRTTDGFLLCLQLTSQDHDRDAADEVGAVARALEALRDTSLRARALESDRTAMSQVAQDRRALLDAEIARFRSQVSEALNAVGAQTGDLRSRSAAMSSSK